MSIYYYPQETLSKLNLDWFLQEVLNKWDSFCYEYQIQRIIIGVTKLMEGNLLQNQGLATEIIRRLPDLVLRYLQVRENENSNGQKNNNDALIDAEE